MAEVDVIPLLGSRVLDSSSASGYTRMARAVRQIGCYTGHYQSLLMLLDRPPALKCPSVSPHLLVLLVKYKAEHLKGTVLLDHNNQPVTYVRIEGMQGPLEQIICVGGWRADSNYMLLKSGMTAIHTAKEEYGDYNKSCDACWAEWANGVRTGWYLFSPITYQCPSSRKTCNLELW
jgi:hypothetical protein